MKCKSGTLEPRGKNRRSRGEERERCAVRHQGDWDDSQPEMRANVSRKTESGKDTWTQTHLIYEVSPATLQRELLSLRCICDLILWVTTHTSWPHDGRKSAGHHLMQHLIPEGISPFLQLRNVPLLHASSYSRFFNIGELIVAFCLFKNVLSQTEGFCCLSYWWIILFFSLTMASVTASADLLGLYILELWNQTDKSSLIWKKTPADFSSLSCPDNFEPRELVYILLKMAVIAE